jgi:transcriptional regulator with XRE-family HTH domain
MTSLRHILALNMKQKRHALDLSQARLAEKINTAPTYIAMIELEKKFPSVDMLEKIAAALEIDAPELFSVEGLPADSLKKLHREILADFEKILNQRLRDLQTESCPSGGSAVKSNKRGSPNT